jgi:hypothetical protein
VAPPFGGRLASHPNVHMLMSFLATLPETGNLFLLGSVLIIAGLVLRRLFSIMQPDSNSQEASEPGGTTLGLPQEKSLSQPMSPQA